MSNNENMPASDEEIGDVKISADVIMVIAHNITTEIEGVAGMSSGIAENILARKGAPRGVKVDMNDKDVNIDLYIIADFGARIPDVAWKIQDRVKSSVESMTGLNVAAINIHVQGVSFDKQKEAL